MSTPDIHAQIMSLPHNPSTFDLLGSRNLIYSRGHAEAQVKAAELALPLQRRCEELEAGLEVAKAKVLALDGAEHFIALAREQIKTWPTIRQETEVAHAVNDLLDSIEKTISDIIEDHHTFRRVPDA